MCKSGLECGICPRECHWGTAELKKGAQTRRGGGERERIEISDDWVDCMVVLIGQQLSFGWNSRTAKKCSSCYPLITTVFSHFVPSYCLECW